LRAHAEKNTPEVSTIEPGTHYKGRLLLTRPTLFYGNMRIYLDTIPFSSSTITPGANGASTTTQTRLNFILQTLYVAQQFYQTRLQAVKLSYITIPDYCVDFAPSNNGSNIANS
jgi:hypothetical protein